MEQPTRYPVLVMCGRDPRRRRIMEALDPEEKYKVKALLPFLGKRVIDWQLEALRQSPYVEGLYLLGLSAEEVQPDHMVHIIPVETTAGFADKLAAGLAHLHAMGKEPEMVVVSSSDAPAVSSESVNAFLAQLAQLRGYDLVLSLVPEEITEAVFPGSRRAVARFRDCQVYPGELYALSPRAIIQGQAVISELHRRRRLLNRRRNHVSLWPVVSYVARRVRVWPLLKFLLGWATLQEAERAFSAAFACRTKGIIIADPGFGMDMDLPEDYRRLEEYVASNQVSH